MLTCRELTERTTDGLEGGLGLFESQGFKLHVFLCRHCSAHLDQMKKTLRLLAALPRAELSPELLQRLQPRFRSWLVSRRESKHL